LRVDLDLPLSHNLGPKSVPRLKPTAKFYTMHDPFFETAYESPPYVYLVLSCFQKLVFYKFIGGIVKPLMVIHGEIDQLIVEVVDLG
jgi:hypothetical protein